jgi:hypothetical protein
LRNEKKSHDVPHSDGCTVRKLASTAKSSVLALDVRQYTTEPNSNSLAQSSGERLLSQSNHRTTGVSRHGHFACSSEERRDAVICRCNSQRCRAKPEHPQLCSVWKAEVNSVFSSGNAGCCFEVCICTLSHKCAEWGAASARSRSGNDRQQMLYLAGA